jgi:photosynthetic reaction center H subunit
MPSGFITSYINVAQLALYAFWIFFAFLVIYLRREDKREGYPLESDRSARAPRVKVVGWPSPPAPKTFLLPHGQGTRQKPEPAVAPGPIPPGTKLKAAWPGAPLVPTGDPMREGVGPASYANRDDVPDLAISGKPKIVPMRVATDFSVEPTDPDPRGMTVFAADGKAAGTVVDLWVDRAEPRILYFEVALKGSTETEAGTPAGNNPLLPYGFARVQFGKKRIEVSSIMSDQFEHVPRTASDEQITRLEEDRICAYFASGHLYAHPSRQEPLI